MSDRVGLTPTLYIAYICLPSVLLEDDSLTPPPLRSCFSVYFCLCLSAYHLSACCMPPTHLTVCRQTACLPVFTLSACQLSKCLSACCQLQVCCLVAFLPACLPVYLLLAHVTFILTPAEWDFSLQVTQANAQYNL